MQSIARRARFLLAEIERLERLHARVPGSVTLVGVSKTHPAACIREAVASGVRHIGESYVQEALPKIGELADLGITWHFVGRIQANKTAAIAANFDWVHGIDRLRIARRLNDQRPAHLAPLQCCLEVNAGNEQGKAGVHWDDVAALALEVAALPRLRLRGLMTLPPGADTIERQREPFAALARCLAGLRQRLPDLDTLSMGMSGDMEAAIAEGATLVRIGTALFGPRAN